MVEENALLQGRERVDVLHVRSATRHASHHPIDLLLGQVRKRQELRRYRRTTHRDQIRWNLHLILPAQRGGEGRQAWACEQSPHITLQARAPHLLKEPYSQQRVSA